MSRTLVGVDGCRKGWIVAVEAPGGEAIRIEVVATFDALVANLPADAIVAVDMPIGLPERIAGPGRVAEQAVRPHLRARRSSVFSMPGRAAVESHPGAFRDEPDRRESHARASALARSLSDPPKGVSIQGFSLFPKVLEVDRALRADAGLAARVFEGHPEMAFRAMNDGLPAETRKRLREDAAGGNPEREALLRRSGIPAAALRVVPAGAARDDLLDALAMLVTARRIARGEAVSYPETPGRDAHGLPVAIRA